MEKIKKIFKENRVMCTLALVVIFCAILMLIMLIKFFYSGTTGSVYGDRLDGIKEVEIKEDRVSTLELQLESDDLITDANIIITGKIVYTYLTFDKESDLEEAKTKAIEILDKYSDEEKKFYDFEFYLKQEESEKSEGFNVSGAHNANGSGLVWNNNNKVEDKPTEE